MSNDFYTKPADAQPLSTIRSLQWNTNNQSVEAGFDKFLSEDDTKRIQYGQDSSSLATLYEVTIPKLPGGVYREGLEVTFTAVFENTGSANVSVNGGTNEPILDGTGAQLVAGSIKAGQTITVIRNSGGAGTGFQLTSTVLLQSDIQTAVDAAAAAAQSASDASDSADAAATSAAQAAEVSAETLIHNGRGKIQQRQDGTLATSFVLGGDRWAFKAEGVVSAGTVTTTSSALAGTSGFAHKVSGATITGAGKVVGRSRYESRDAVDFKNAAVVVSATVHHDVGSNINYVIRVNKATAVDDFSSVSVVAASPNISVPTGASTAISLTVSNIGDVTNGIEVVIEADCGAVTTKNFELTDLQFKVGTITTDFNFRSIPAELLICQRFAYRPEIGVGQFTRFCDGSWVSATQMTGTLYFPGNMRASPTMTIEGALSQYAVNGAGSLSSVTPSGIAIIESSPSSVYFAIDSAAGGQTAGQGSSFFAIDTNNVDSLLFESEL